MLRRLEALFDPDHPRRDSLMSLIISDYVAYYRPTATRTKWCVGGSQKEDSPRRLALLFIPRLINNPCLHATLLIRIALRGPRLLLGFWRTVLIAKHSIDIQGGVKVGPGFMLPHPVGIVLGWGIDIQRDVTILHHVTIGGMVGHPEEEPQLSPALGRDVVIFADSFVLGPIKIGDGAIVAAGAWVDEDLAPGKVHPGRAALFRQLASSRGEARQPG